MCSLYIFPQLPKVSGLDTSMHDNGKGCPSTSEANLNNLHNNDWNIAWISSTPQHCMNNSIQNTTIHDQHQNHNTEWKSAQFLEFTLSQI